MKKVSVMMRVSVHPVKAAIWEQRTKITPDMSLREIGTLIGLKNKPQVIKHHLETMVKMGAIDFIGGNYFFPKS